MDQIAVISDIHGNLPALESTLAHIHSRGIDSIYCLGDLVGKGPEPEKAVDLCREACTSIVQGNWDQHLKQPTTKESRIWHKERLGEERLEYLYNLPGVIDLTISGQHVRFYHASQRSVHYRVYYWADFKKLQAMFDNTDFTGHSETTPNMVIYGDIHEAFMLPVAGGRLINAGSVGNPTDRIPMASYLIVRGHIDSPIRAPIDIEFVRVPYDKEAAIDIARTTGMPDLAEYAFEVRNGRYRKNMPIGYIP